MPTRLFFYQKSMKVGRIIVKPRVLFCATVDIHFKKFHLPYLKWFKEKGYEVHVAANGNILLPYVDQKFTIPIQRSPLSAKNWRSYKELKKLIDNNHYQIVHCHTPMGGVLTRLAARRARRSGTKVIYTAHGFHFCKGVPLLNWLLYYPIEKGLARLTDCLITINEEDTQLANEHHFKAGRIEHVHGVGVDTEQFTPIVDIQKHRLRENLGFQSSDFIMFYAAEFNNNKNQQFLIKALALIKDLIPNIKLLLAGDGPLLETCQSFARQLGVDRLVHFLGYQNDVKPFLQISDIAVGSSLREGLPVNIMEAMACGLPILATKNRGHCELVENGSNGFIVMPGDREIFAARLLQLYRNPSLRKKMGDESIKRMERYSLNQVSQELRQIYSRYMLQVDQTEGESRRAYL
jgi:glycosyltransferase EpsD